MRHGRRRLLVAVVWAANFSRAASVPPREIAVALIWEMNHQASLNEAAMFQMLVDEANADAQLFPNTTLRPVVLDVGISQAERIDAIRAMYQEHGACLSYGLGRGDTGELMGTTAKAYRSNHGFFLDIFMSSMPLYVDVSNTFAVDGLSSMMPSMLDIGESLRPPVKRWGLILTSATRAFYDSFVAQQKARGAHTAYQVIQTDDIWSKSANQYLTDEQILQNARDIVDGAVESKANVFFMCFCLITNVAYKVEFLRYANSRGLFAEGYQWFTFYGAIMNFIEDFIYNEEYTDLWEPLTHLKVLDVTDFEPGGTNYSYYRESETSELSFDAQLAKLQPVIDRYDGNWGEPGNGWSSLSWLNCSLPEHSRLTFCKPEWRPMPIGGGAVPHLDGVRQGLRSLHNVVYEQGHHDFCDMDVYGRRKGDPSVFTRELVSKPFNGVGGNRIFVEMPVTGGTVPALGRTWHLVDFRPHNVGECEGGCAGRFRLAGPTEMHTNPAALPNAPITERVLHRNFKTAEATDYATIGWMGNTTDSPKDWFHGMCGRVAYINLTSVEKECVPCAAGLFNAPDDEVDQCVPVEAFHCPRGMELAPALATSGIPCRNCTAGFFESQSGCERCPEGQFQSMPGSSACMACPAGRTTRYLGAEDGQSCRCPPGTYAKSGECLKCGEGTSCKGWDQQVPNAASGFMISPEFQGHGEFPVFNCFGDAQRCPGGPPGTCAKGRTGLGCADCKDGMSEGENGECETCGDFSSAPFLIGVVLALLLPGFLYRDSFKKNLVIRHFDTLFFVSAVGVLVTSLQMLSVIQLLPFEWGSPMDEILEFTKIFVLDIDVLSPECVVDAGAFSKYVMLALFVPAILVVACLYHLVVVLSRGLHSVPTRSLTTGLRNTCGVITSLTFTSYMALLASAFQCHEHPTGVSTMQKYESVVCWDSDDHTAVLAIAFVFMLLPVTFLSMCAWATIQFPSRLVRGDAAFFQNWAFVFLRFRARCSWFSLAILARGFVLPLTTAFMSPVMHIFSMQVILLGFLGALCTLRPRKVAYINILDIAVNIPVVLIVGMAPFFVFMPDRGFAATLTAICCICCLLFIPLAIVAKLMHTLITRGKRRFQFFLCHHKDGAGYFSRLLKMELQGDARVHRQVFLDCDNLSDLTTLFSLVRDNTETLVAICSKDLLWRPWCMGEIVTTHQSGVKLVPVIFPDFSFLSDDACARYSKLVRGGSCLAEFGIEDTMIEGAASWFQAVPKIEFPHVVNDVTMQALTTAIIVHAEGEVQVAPCSTPAPGSTTVIVAAVEDTEAASAACLLRLLMGPTMMKDARDIPFVAVPGQVLPNSVKQIFVICSQDCFKSRHIQSMLLQGTALSAHFLPVVVQQGFTFPNARALAQLVKEANPASLAARVRALLGDVQDIGQMYANVVGLLFKEIAVFITYSDTEPILEARATQLRKRMKGVTTSISTATATATPFYASIASASIRSDDLSLRAETINQGSNGFQDAVENDEPGIVSKPLGIGASAELTRKASGVQSMGVELQEATEDGCDTEEV